MRGVLTMTNQEKRTKRISARCSDQHKLQAKLIAQTTNESMSTIYDRLINAEFDRLELSLTDLLVPSTNPSASEK